MKPNGPTRDLDLVEAEVTSPIKRSLRGWIESGNFQFRKDNEAPWGSYNLVVSHDNGKSWIGFPRRFGWGYTELQAFELLLTECVQSDTLRPQLINWIGEEQTNTIAQILSETKVA
jgi:hypothetical protein